MVPNFTNFADIILTMFMWVLTFLGAIASLDLAFSMRVNK